MYGEVKIKEEGRKRRNSKGWFPTACVKIDEKQKFPEEISSLIEDEKNKKQK